jgi:hypothetical protein
MFQEKEYSNIRFDLVRLIANDLMVNMTWDSLTDEQIIKIFEKQLMLLGFYTCPIIENRTNGLHLSIKFELDDGNYGVINCHIVPTSDMIKV